MNQHFAVTKLHGVIFVNKDKYHEKVTAFRADHCRNELIYHFSGRATVTFNGKRLETAPDTVRFLPAGEVREYVVERHEFGECVDIFFDSDVPVSDEAFVIQVRQNEAIKQLFKKFFAVWVAKGEGYYFECVSLLYRIFAELQKKSYIPEAQYLRIKPVVDYINDRFAAERITAEALLSRCDVSYPYLKKLFVKRFGMPPVRYAIQLKINYACDLLRSKQYSVSQAAEAAGYPDANYFSRQFKAYMGCSPSEYLEMSKEW